MNTSHPLRALPAALWRALCALPRAFCTGCARRIRRVAAFVRADHRYVFLFGALVWALSVLLVRPYFGARPPRSQLCLLYALPPAALAAATAPGALFVPAGLGALIARWRHGKRHWRAATCYGRPWALRTARWGSWYVTAVCALLALDAGGMRLASVIQWALQQERNPQGFFTSMVYMGCHGGDMLWYGIRTTVELALLGTLIGFVLACLLVFMRIQRPDKRDNDLVRGLKKLALAFSKTYITVVRGTPMMVQASIIYYAGINVVQALAPQATVSQQLALWPVFLAGLVTVSLNTTAYIAEVLRGGVEAIDRGQTEAARSLGMGQWQTMCKVVFPQAIRNSIPAIGNEFIINIKDSSVLNVIGVIELMFAARTVSGTYYKYLPVYCLTALIYLCLTWLATTLLNAVSASLGAPKSKGLPSSN